MNRGIDERSLDREVKVAALIAAHFKRSFGRMGEFMPYDTYFMLGGRMTSVAEIRTRHQRFEDDDRLMIDIDKWHALLMAEVGLRIPAHYIVAFLDGIWWGRIGTLPVNEYEYRVTGRRDRVGFPNDLCPVIQMPRRSDWFIRFGDATGVFDE